MSFNPETEHSQLAPALDLYQYQLKGVSCEWAAAVGPLLCESIVWSPFFAVLPRIKFGAYPQMPYEAVSEEVFREYVRNKV